MFKKSTHEGLSQIHLLRAGIQTEADHPDIGRDIPDRDKGPAGANVALVHHRVGAHGVGVGAQKFKAAVEQVGAQPDGVCRPVLGLKDVPELDLTLTLIKAEVGRAHHRLHRGEVGAHDGDLRGGKIAG